MRTSGALASILLGWPVASGLLPVAAFADGTATPKTTEQCIVANTDAQSLRRSGKFSEARDKLKLCINAACPRMVSADCGNRLEELDRVQPSFVFDAKDPAGRDLTDVAVSVDGNRLTEKLDGTALPVDPGLHTFKFELKFAGAGPSRVVERLVANEGEKARRVSVVLGSVALDTAVVAASARSDDDRGQDHSANQGTRRPLGVAIAGVGVAALAVGGVFGLLANDAKKSYEKYCGGAVGAPTASSCTQQGVDGQKDAASKATVSTIALIGGGVLAALGVVLFVTAPDGKSASVGLGPDGLRLEGAF